jgi:large subunit ribosomal protein L9
MRIILKENVPSLGSFGDIVKVADGYARNYLIPRSIAIEATKSNLAQFEAERVSWDKKAQNIKEQAEKLTQELEPLELNFPRKAGDEEKIFGSVTSIDIEQELKKKGFNQVDKKDILLDEPIKKLGVYTVGIKLHPEVTANIKVWVVKE